MNRFISDSMKKTIHDYLNMAAVFRSAEITDLGILAIAQGCPGLEMINIAYCKDITDRSLLSFSKCSRLKTLESRGCSLITSLGLTAIAVGCKEITKLDIKKCQNIDDAGMLPLAHFSQNLRQVCCPLLCLELCLKKKSRHPAYLIRSFLCRLTCPIAQLQT